MVPNQRVRATRLLKPADGGIGLGIMGSAMSANLMRAGYRVIGYDLLAKRRQAHRRAGGGGGAGCRGRAGGAAAWAPSWPGGPGASVCSLPASDALLATATELAAARSEDRPRHAPRPQQ